MAMLGSLTQFWGLVRELDLVQLRADIQRPVGLALRGAEGSGRHTLARALLGGDSAAAGAHILPVAAETPASVDATLLVLDGRAAPDDATRVAAARLAASGPLLIVHTFADQVPEPARCDQQGLGIAAPEVWVDARDAEAVRETLGTLLAERLPHLALALGRRAPVLRPSVATALIRDASRVNAEFALLSNLPAVIPLAGGLAGDAADLLVLTKNQALLVFKLAGLYGRDLGNLRALALEILPVVGGALFWRTLARSAAGLLPPMVGAAPKTAVAFVGTFVVGQIARFYYEHGRRPTREAVARFRDEGARLFAQLATRLGRGRKEPDAQAS